MEPSDDIVAILKGVARSLETVLAQRTATHAPTPGARARKGGEIWGLKTSLAAIRRRIAIIERG